MAARQDCRPSAPRRGMPTTACCCRPSGRAGGADWQLVCPELPPGADVVGQRIGIGGGIRKRSPRSVGASYLADAGCRRSERCSLHARCSSRRAIGFAAPLGREREPAHRCPLARGAQALRLHNLPIGGGSVAAPCRCFREPLLHIRRGYRAHAGGGQRPRRPLYDATVGWCAPPPRAPDANPRCCKPPLAERRPPRLVVTSGRQLVAAVAAVKLLAHALNDVSSTLVV